MNEDLPKVLTAAASGSGRSESDKRLFECAAFEIERLRAALKPFADAVDCANMASKLGKERGLTMGGDAQMRSYPLPRHFTTAYDILNDH